MERLVPVFDPKRKAPLSIRLRDVPSLFSEGSERETPAAARLAVETLLARLAAVMRGADRR